MPDFIFDNTVLSNFAAIGKADLLAKLFEKNAFTTIEVMDELKRGIERGYLHLVPVLNAAESSKGWLKILVLKSLDESLLRQELDEFLHPGESSCLVFSVSRNMILVTDDLAARKLAARRNVRLTGTVGLLVEMIHAGLLPLEEGNTLLEKMIDSGYRSPCDRLDECI
jgi:predicted nucleic acid-binding protein